jgi:UDP-N-acetylmuramoylalanine--D-glutamate ligase
MIDIKDKKIVILGAARSGLAAAKLLHKKQAVVFVSDHADQSEKQEAIKILRDQQISYEFGQHSDKVFEADLVVLSPGISSRLKIVWELRSKGIPVFSELEIASWFCASPIIAVTGSNGKTTTTTLLGEMLRTEMPQSIVAGNIGNAFSDFVLDSNKSNWAAIEVSSFQLETIDTFHPRVVVILNLAPNHLDWYDSFEDYIRAKLFILKNLQKDDYLIYNADDTFLEDRIRSSPAKKKTFSLSKSNATFFKEKNKLILEEQILITTDQIRLNGNHNYQNAMAAALAAKIAGIDDQNIVSVLSSFKGVEHRLEFVVEIKGVNFINDSKATTVESLSVALTSFKTPIILIAGGKDKGSDYHKLDDLISKHVREIVLIGSAREKMSAAWQHLCSLHQSETLSDAVELAFRLAKPGENVLLSPACSSFDMFQDYEDRGKQFKEIVNRVKSEYENQPTKK